MKSDKVLAEVEEVFTDMQMKVQLLLRECRHLLSDIKNMMTGGKFANAALGGALFKFGWVFGGTVRSSSGGFMRRSRRIPVSAAAAG